MEELQDLLVVHAGDLLALLRQDLLDIRAVVVEVPQVGRRSGGDCCSRDTESVRLRGCTPPC